MESTIISWANQEDAIRALILTGSRAGKQNPDSLADYDLSVFCDSYESYVNSDEWIASLGNVWVWIPEKLSFNDKTFPTRLVIYEEGVKVDFAFFTMDIFEDLCRKDPLPAEYDRGYKILLDKEGTTKTMAKPAFKGFKQSKPSEEEFLGIINEFWFEVHHVAKYLKREDLWSVKFRSGAIHDNYLLKMIRWNEQAKHDWNLETNPIGKRMQSWVDEKTWNALQGVFAHFDSKDGQQCLMNLMTLFRDLSLETANLIGYRYPQKLDKNISEFVEKLSQ